MIVWGSVGQVLDLGRLEERMCSNCGRVQPFQLRLAYRRFHLYWIFRMVTKKQYSISCVVCDHGWELESRDVQAVVGKPPIPLWDKYGLLVLVAVVAGLAYVSIPTFVGRDEAGVIISEGDIDVFRVQVGDCYNDATAVTDPDEQSSFTELGEVDGVPCTDPHDNEVYALVDLDLSSYPGQEQISDLAAIACLDRFQDFVGREYETSILDFYWMFPTRESFADQDREVVCSMYHMDGLKLSGSMRGSGQ